MSRIAPSTSSNTTATNDSTRRFGLSEIANLFIRLRRHRSRASLASQVKRDASPPEQHQWPLRSPSPLPARMILTPPASPSRNRIRRITGSPYSRNRTTSSSPPPKAHHLVSSSGETPLTHQGIADSRVDGARTLPVEYTDRFECAGGVNTPTLLRATRKAMLEAIGGLGANALVDERWTCIICGPKHGSYKVEINYSATATHCTILDGFRPVALDQARGIPGLMTITKRNDE